MSNSDCGPFCAHSVSKTIALGSNEIGEQVTRRGVIACVREFPLRANAFSPGARIPQPACALHNQTAPNSTRAATDGEHELYSKVVRSRPRRTSALTTRKNFKKKIEIADSQDVPAIAYVLGPTTQAAPVLTGGGLCPVLCPPPNPTDRYRVSAPPSKCTKSLHL
jgi:hypothetical protein